MDVWSLNCCASEERCPLGWGSEPSTRGKPTEQGNEHNEIVPSQEPRSIHLEEAVAEWEFKSTWQIFLVSDPNGSPGFSAQKILATENKVQLGAHLVDLGSGVKVVLMPISSSHRYCLGITWEVSPGEINRFVSKLDSINKFPATSNGLD